MTQQESPDQIDATATDLEAHMGYWLRRVSNHVSSAFTRSLQQRQTSVAEWVALTQIRSVPNVAPGELAERLGMTRGAISKIVDKLEIKGWIERSANPDDRRGQGLKLTTDGEQILPELARIADANDAEFFNCLDIEERRTLRELLQKLTEEHHWNDTPHG